MALYHINVTDAVTGQPVVANVVFLDGPAGNAILAGGVPAAVQTDVNGNVQFNNAMAQVYARVQASLYASQNVTLMPGSNNIKLNGAGSTDYIVTGTRTFYEKYKTIIWLVLIALAVILGVKYKVIPL